MADALRERLSRMPATAWRDAGEAIFACWGLAVDKLKTEAGPLRRKRLNAAQRERIAYLKGVAHGYAGAAREFEKRMPVQFYASEAQSND